jgi:hypothetical protein
MREELPAAIAEMVKVLKADNTSAGNKIKAFMALSDRAGVPEVKATVTQTVTARVTAEELAAQRDSLLIEEAEIKAELEELKVGGVEDAKARRDAILPRPQQEG